jgi:signal peptidase I
MRGRHRRKNAINPRKEALEWILSLVIALGVGLILHFFVFQLVRVDGPSMQPNLHTDQRMFCTPATYFFRKPVRGEVVITSFPNRPGETFVKRVIGLPGEKIAVHDGAVYINGTAISEPYIKAPIQYVMEETVVPQDSVFVMGDNRNDSSDSHDPSVGPLPLKMIKGKVHAVVWPISEFTIVPTPEYSQS